MRSPATFLLILLTVVTGAIIAGCGGPSDPPKALAEACERQRAEVIAEHDAGDTAEAKTTKEFVENEKLVECAGQPALASEAGGEGGHGEEAAEGEGEAAGAEGEAPPTPAAAAMTPAELASAKVLFADKCASCHTLADADATGAVGPNLDESDMSADEISEQIENGGGGMPPKLLEGDDAAAVASYIDQVAGS